MLRYFVRTARQSEENGQMVIDCLSRLSETNNVDTNELISINDRFFVPLIDTVSKNRALCADFPPCDISIASTETNFI